MTIEQYLAELRELLPSTRRGRFLAEVESHLHDATDAQVARGVDRASAEAAAVEASGHPQLVAARMRRVTAPIAIRRASFVALVGLGLLFLPLYVVPENLLPPAPWDDRPAHLGVLLAIALAGWIVAALLAAVAAAAPPRIAAAALACCAAATLTSASAALAAGLVWHVEAPETPWSVTAVGAPIAAIAFAVVTVGAAWARERARSLA